MKENENLVKFEAGKKYKIVNKYGPITSIDYFYCAKRTAKFVDMVQTKSETIFEDGRPNDIVNYNISLRLKIYTDEYKNSEYIYGFDMLGMYATQIDEQK